MTDQILETEKKKNQAQFRDIEAKLLVWFTEQRRVENPVSLKMIREEALRVFAQTNKDPHRLFRASTGWLYGFFARNKIAKRKATHISQKLPDEFAAKVVTFMKDVDNKRRQLLNDKNTVSILIGNECIRKPDNFSLGNMDEVPVYYD